MTAATLPLSPLTLDELGRRLEAATQQAGTYCGVLASASDGVTDRDIERRLLEIGAAWNLYLDAVLVRRGLQA